MIATLCNGLLGHEIVVRVIPLPRFLFAVFRNTLLFLMTFSLYRHILLACLFQRVVLLRSQVWKLLDFGLVEAIDDRVFALGDVDAFNLSWGVRQKRYKSLAIRRLWMAEGAP